MPRSLVTRRSASGVRGPAAAPIARPAATVKLAGRHSKRIDPANYGVDPSAVLEEIKPHLAVMT